MERTWVGLKKVDPPIVLNSDEVLKKFDLTFREVKEYTELKAAIFGKGQFKELFVELDLENNSDHIRYNELSGKMIHLHAFLLSHRREFS